MSCEYRNCQSAGVFRAHKSVWCKWHIQDIKDVRKVLNKSKPERKRVLDLINGRLTIVNRNESKIIGEFISRFESDSCTTETTREARRVLSNMVEKLRTEVFARRKELKMRKNVCEKHIHFFRKCTYAYKKASIDMYRTELVDRVERERSIDDLGTDIMIAAAEREHSARVESIERDVNQMEEEIHDMN